MNDPNDRSREQGQPRYILELLARIVTVSLETMVIVDDLPPLATRADQNLGWSARGSAGGSAARCVESVVLRAAWA